MGWSYENRIAFGFIVNSWDNPELENILNRHNHVLGYDSRMSLKGHGTMFVYLKSKTICR